MGFRFAITAITGMSAFHPNLPSDFDERNAAEPQLAFRHGRPFRTNEFN